MASTTINPTRMELTRLKTRRKTAVRGHKLLKDKRDELMRQFLDIVRLNRELRAKVEKSLMEAHSAFTVASAIMSPEMLEQALSYPKQAVSIDMKFKNIMSVNVPEYTFHTKNDDPAEIYPYGFAQTSGELDDALDALSGMIPEMEENIKFISMKLDENERSSTARLMKVKDMMLEEERQKSELKRQQREKARQAAKEAEEQSKIAVSTEAAIFLPSPCPAAGGALPSPGGR